MALTKSQNEAVFHKNGNVLIQAGAGAGKTTAFTARVANLIANEKVDPSTILAMTFTNEAADNMRSKLASLIGKTKANSVEITTFHSFAYKTLKSKYAHVYGEKKIIQQWWKFSKLYDLIAVGNKKNPIGLNLIDNEGKQINAGDLSQFISYQKANMINPGSAVLIDDKVSYVKNVGRRKLQDAYDTYCDLVKHARVLEFDDMLMDFYYYLEENEELLNDIKGRYNYIMVDEMQDTNSVNMEILKLITDNNLYAVGDFRQGIYGFINANIDNILSFKTTFPDVNLIEFRENFRSTKTIVGFCNTIIEKSPVDKYKQFQSQKAARKETGSDISIKYYQDEILEAKEIVEEISQQIDDNWERSLSDYAVICRTNAQLGMYESMFADIGIRVDVSSSKSFFDRKEVSDILAYAQHTIDPTDDMSLRKIINAPNRFVSKQTINDLDKYSFEHGVTLENALMQMDSGRSRSSLMTLANHFEDMREETDINASKFLRMIYNSIGYRDHLEKKSTSHTELMIRQEAIDRLFDISKKFPTIEAFLGHVSLIRNNNNSKGKEAIKLLTVHASKGLEFEVVFAPGVTNANFPHPMNADFEEERRLFYVVCSRAKDHLFISSHVFQGAKQEVVAASPFLVDTVGKKINDMRKNVLRGAETQSLSVGMDSVSK